MGYGLNISNLADQIAEQAIPQGKGGRYARFDKDAARVLSAALSITLREVVSSRPELKRLLALADHPVDETRAETFRKHDEYDQHQILHRIKVGMKRLKPCQKARPEKGALTITQADGVKQTVYYYRLGVHYVSVTYEGDMMPVKCERFDNETCELVRDWSMLMRIENSLEVDRLTVGEFVLYCTRQKEKRRLGQEA